MNNADTNAKPETPSFRDWAKKMRQRAARDLVRAAAGDARALAQARKPKKQRRGTAATATGLLQQQLAADFE